MTDGETLIANRYRLISQVGSGAMGVVWRARDERLGRTVAVKQLRTPIGMTEAQIEQSQLRARREARIAARLHHPHAVAVYDVVDHDGHPCLIMEYIPSSTLSAVLADGEVLPPAQVAEMGMQLASALLAAHEAGIVHRDVKPGNILIAEDGSVKLTDFGISRATGDVTVTATGEMLGTPAYTSPEVAQGRAAGVASDVFSLGATLYAALEGEPPFGTGPTAMALLLRIVNGEIRRPRHNSALMSTVMSMLRHDPADRPSMDEVRRSLELANAETIAVAPLSLEEEPPAQDGQRPEDGPGGRGATAVEGAALVGGVIGAGAGAGVAAADGIGGGDKAGAGNRDGIGGGDGIVGADGAEDGKGVDGGGAGTPVPAADAGAAAGPTPSPSSPSSEPAPSSESAAAATAAAADGPAGRRRWTRKRLLPFVLLGVAALLAAGIIAAVMASGGSGGAPTTPAKTTAATAHASRSASASASASARASSTPSKSPSNSPSTSQTTSSPTTSATTTATSATATAQQLSSAIENYYQLVPGHLDQAWNYMTASYQQNTAKGMSGYRNFWAQIDHVTLSDLVASPPSTVVVTIDYFYKDGHTVQERTQFGLVRQDGILKIATSSVLSSRTL